MSAADDKVLPGFFKDSLALLEKHPQASLCTGLGRMMNEAGQDTGLRALPIIADCPCFLGPAEVRRELLRYGRWFAVSSMIIRREPFVAEGGQITALGSFADTFILRVQIPLNCNAQYADNKILR